MSATEQRAIASLVVGDDGRLVIPSDVVDEAGLEPGDTVDVELTLKGVLLVPVVTDAEMEAFWGPKWREELDQAEADVAAGRTTIYYSDEEFLAALEARMHADPWGGRSLPSRWARLTHNEQAASLVALRKFIHDLRRGEFRKGLRVQRLKRTEDQWEMTWAPDGRVVVRYGPSIRPGDPHVVWLRIGGHDILDEA